MDKKHANILPWSYSSLDSYATCPRRYYLTKVVKLVKEPQTEATISGNEVHKALENYVGGTAPLPSKYDSYREVATKVKQTAGKKLVEYKFGLTKGLKPSEFFGSDTWVRGVLDVCIIRPEEVIVLDWKTGKRKVDGDQLRLFAGAAMSLWPFAKKVKTGYIWLKTGELDTKEFTPDDKPEIFQDFAARVHRLETSGKNDDWPARPSGLCRNWCPVGRNNCEHCGV